jgi:hypothetical protein
MAMKIAVSGDSWLGQHAGYQGQQPRKGDRHARDADQADPHSQAAQNRQI